MHRQNRLRTGSNRRLDGCRIKRERTWINVDQDWSRASVENSRDAGNKRERYRDDFVIGPDPCREQRQMQRAGAGIQSDALRRSAVRGKLTLERRNFAAENELAAFEYLGYRGVDLGLDAPVLRLQIEIRNLHWIAVSLNFLCDVTLSAAEGISGSGVFLMLLGCLLPTSVLFAYRLPGL